MNNNTLSLFDIFGEDEEVKAFNEEQERIAEDNKVKETKKPQSENNKEIKSENKKNTNKKEDTNKKEKKKSEAKAAPKKDKKTIIQEECAASGCQRIIVEVVAEKIHTIEDPEEIKSINLDSFKKIMVEKGFEIFAVMEPIWNFVKSEDGSVGFLIATYPQFYAKG